MAETSDEPTLRQRSVHVEQPQSQQAPPSGAAGSEGRPRLVRKPSDSRWKLAGNTLKANMRLQDMGIDKAYKDLSLQRPAVQEDGNIATGRQKRPVFGDVQFSNGSQTRYCVIGAEADPSVVFERIINHPEVWNLEPPRLLLSVMGGAGGMSMDKSVENMFSEGLVRVAKQTGAWVITGGTNSGVMALAGQAMGSHDKKRIVPCIGITSFGSLQTKWRCQLDMQDEAKVMKIVDAPPLDDKEPLPAIQENHTHSILVDGGKRGGTAFGQEAKFRAEFEHHVARKLDRTSSTSSSLERKTSNDRGRSRVGTESFGSRRSTLKRGGIGRVGMVEDMRAEALRVMILLNGGPVSFESVYLALQHECPVVVCRGSGRAADFLATLKDSGEKSLEAYEKAWKAYMTAPPDKKSWQEKWGVQGSKEHTMLEEILHKYSSGLVVYSSKDRLEDVVIGAVLQSIWAQGDSDGSLITNALKQSLDLAVCWQCTKHCRDLCARMLNATNDGSSFFEATRWILSMLVTKVWVESDASHIVRLLFELCPNYMRSFHLTNLEPPSLKWNGIAGFADYSGQDDKDGSESDTAQDEANRANETVMGRSDCVPALLLWLIENGASRSVIDVLWQHQEYPAHAALAAASCYRQMASAAHYGHSAATRQGYRLEDEAFRYETLAIKLVQGLEAHSRIETTDFLFNHSKEWGGKNLITLAHQLECKSFVMEQFFVSAVDALWFTPAPFEEYYYRKGKRENLMDNSLFELAHIAILSAFETELDIVDMDRREFWCVPKVKALTHGLFRIIFISLYSVCVLYSEGWMRFLLRLVLFVWGISLGLVEILQIRQKDSFTEYLHGWNTVDFFYICVLLFNILSEATIVPLGVLDARDVHVLDAINLLPCYLRLLQMFELSEYFGTLFVTIVDMMKDTANFMVLLFVFSMGFSCALTPILWPREERWSQGVFWTFWAIFGERDEGFKKEQVKETVFGFIIPPLYYSLYLVLNVLLVNLLIAMLSDTFSANKEQSRRVWAFQCVDAVLEFASEEIHVLPPPLDLGYSLKSLLNSSDQEEGEDKSFCQAPNRQEKRAIHQLQQKLLENVSEDTGDNETVEAVAQLERQLRLYSIQVDKFANDEITALRKEISDLKAENQQLKAELGKKGG